MRKHGLKRAVSPLSAALVAWLALAPPAPATAEIGDIVTVRRALGLAFVGGSAALTAQGFDYRRQADDFYGSYKAAVDPVEIDRLYQRTTNRDVKAQVSWALAAAFGISGLRLLLTGDAEVRETAGHHSDAGARLAGARARGTPSRPSPPVLSIDPVADGRQIGLQLNRRFF